MLILHRHTVDDPRPTTLTAVALDGHPMWTWEVAALAALAPSLSSKADELTGPSVPPFLEVGLVDGKSLLVGAGGVAVSLDGASGAVLWATRL